MNPISLENDGVHERGKRAPLEMLQIAAIEESTRGLQHCVSETDTVVSETETCDAQSFRSLIRGYFRSPSRRVATTTHNRIRYPPHPRDWKKCGHIPRTTCLRQSVPWADSSSHLRCSLRSTRHIRPGARRTSASHGRSRFDWRVSFINIVLGNSMGWGSMSFQHRAHILQARADCGLQIDYATVFSWRLVSRIFWIHDIVLHEDFAALITEENENKQQ